VTASGRRPRWPGADQPGRRLFIAVPFPSEAEAEIAAVVERVRADGVPDGGRDVRWVRLDSLHLTLRFLGPTHEDGVEPAAAATRSAAVACEPFDISIGRAGAFPSAGRPRALWLDVRAGEPELARLAAAVDRALRDVGWQLEEKPFRAHLTLARADGVPAGSVIGARLVAAATDLDVRFRADRIGLYESLTGGGPARYEPIEVVALGGRG
jgi:RNA 2',3'-cyclic 3'-phosphodiesterase